MKPSLSMRWVVLNRFSRVALGVLASVAVCTGPLAGVLAPTKASAATVAQRCEAAKLKAAGKELRAKMLCYARAKNAAAPVDATCLTNAQTKADATINPAGGACPGSASDIDAAVDGCVSAFLTDDPGNGACRRGARKPSPTGRKASSRAKPRK